MASRDRSPLDDRLSRSPSRSRSMSRPPTRSRTRSPPPRSDYSRSPPPFRRSSRSRSRSRDSRSPPPRRNGRFRSPSYSRERDPRDRSRSRSRSRSETPVRSTKIVVERLTKNVNEDHLHEIFGYYGEIRDLDLPINRQFGTNRGTAYILYAQEADAEAAIAHMHEAQLDGATINVSIVLPRRKFSPSPPLAHRGANFDPRNPPPFRSGGPGGFGGGRGGRRWSALGPPPGPSRFGPRSDTYRPGSYSRSRSRSPADDGRARYRSRSPYSERSRSRSPPPPRRGSGRRESEDYVDRRRSPSQASYSSYDRRSRSRSGSRSRGRGERPYR